MKIKESNFSKTNISRFDLLGYKETALCKAFAYVLSHDRAIFQEYMRELFSIKHSGQYFKNSNIEVKKNYPNVGRIDIEINFEDYQIIIEAKTGFGKVGEEQNKKYIQCFKSNKQKILCFITQQVPSNRIVKEAIKNNVKIIYLTWIDIISIIQNQSIKNNDNKTLLTEFNRFFERGYKMKNIKEILIQDLGIETEIDRYFNNYLYRRGPTVGTPLYFSPYFTEKAISLEKTEIKESGCGYISSVIGALTGNKNDVLSQTDKFEEMALLFSENKDEQKIVIKK